MFHPMTPPDLEPSFQQAQAILQEVWAVQGDRAGHCEERSIEQNEHLTAEMRLYSQMDEVDAITQNKNRKTGEK